MKLACWLHPVAKLALWNMALGRTSRYPKIIEKKEREVIHGWADLPDIYSPGNLKIEIIYQDRDSELHIATVLNSPPGKPPWYFAAKDEDEAIYGCVQDVIRRPNGEPRSLPIS